jgi:hypothetical protein
MFKPIMIALTGAAAIGVGFAGSAEANSSLEYDQDVTPDVIFGDGNDNGSFTVNRHNGIELGLRGKLRFNDSNQPENTFNSNGDGTYSFDAGLPPMGFGFAPGAPTTPIWNFEWSINSDYEDTTGNALSSYDYRLDIDFDAGIGQNFLSFDPINLPFADHGIGNNTTGNGDGTVASDALQYSNLIASNNVAQNSWSMEYFNNAPFDSFDPTVDGTYDFRLTAFEKGTQTQLAQTQMQIIVGQGATDPGQPVPEPASLLGLAAVGAIAAGGAIKKRVSA